MKTSLGKFSNPMLVAITLALSSSTNVSAQTMIMPMSATSWGDKVTVAEGERLIIKPRPRLRMPKKWRARILKATKNLMMNTPGADTACISFDSGVYQFEYSDETQDIVGFIPDIKWLHNNGDRSFGDSHYIVVLEEADTATGDKSYSQVIFIRKSALKDYLSKAAELTIVSATYSVRSFGFGPPPAPLATRPKISCVTFIKRKDAELELPMLAACSSVSPPAG